MSRATCSLFSAARVRAPPRNYPIFPARCDYHRIYKVRYVRALPRNYAILISAVPSRVFLKRQAPPCDTVRQFATIRDNSRQNATKCDNCRRPIFSRKSLKDNPLQFAHTARCDTRTKSRPYMAYITAKTARDIWRPYPCFSPQTQPH